MALACMSLCDLAFAELGRCMGFEVSARGVCVLYDRDWTRGEKAQAAAALQRDLEDWTLESFGGTHLVRFETDSYVLNWLTSATSCYTRDNDCDLAPNCAALNRFIIYSSSTIIIISVIVIICVMMMMMMIIIDNHIITIIVSIIVSIIVIIIVVVVIIIIMMIIIIIISIIMIIVIKVRLQRRQDESHLRHVPSAPRSQRRHRARIKLPKLPPK